MSTKVPSLLGDRHTDDVYGTTEAANHSRGLSGHGCNYDTLSVGVNSHRTGSVRNRVDIVSDSELGGKEELLVVDAALGELGDLGHTLNGLYGILTCGSLTGEHNRGGSVVNRVSNVGYLGSCRSRIVYHTLEHLSSGDNALAEKSALLDKILLNGGNLYEGDLNAEVAAGYHDAICNLADLFNIIYARTVLIV